MNWYPIALFAHIVGALTLFISLALQWLSALRVRRAQTLTQAREWSGLARSVNRLAPITGVLIVGAGVYMLVVAWSMTTAWLDIAIAAMLLMMILSMGISGRGMSAIQRATIQAPAQASAAGATDAIPAALQARIDAPALWLALQMSVAVALSIVFMMTTKPGLLGALVAVIVALALGALVGWMTLRPRRVGQAAALHVNGVKDVNEVHAR
jgi:hypothetical protein